MNNILCHGCLSSGRKLKLLNDFLKTQSFLQILSEIRMCPPNKSLVSVCWECEALLSRFIKFKKQVQYSYSLLSDCIANKIQLTQIEKQSNLNINIIDSINIVTCNEKDIVNDIKLEQDILDEEDLKSEEPPKDDSPDDEAPLTPIELENDETFCNTEDTKDFEILTSKSYTSSKETLEEKSRKDSPKKVLKRVKVKNGIKKKRTKKKETDFCSIFILTAEEIEAERLVLATSEVYVNSSIKCDKCIKAFANVNDLKDHITEKHNLKEYKYKCDICECVFTNLLAYKYHKNKHYKRYQCIVCDVSLVTHSAILRHYRTEHTIEPKTYYRRKRNEVSHQTRAQNNLTEGSTNLEETNDNSSVTYPCEMCDKVFKWKTSLVKHVETHRIQNGEKRKPLCEPCGLSFSTSSNLQKHCKTSARHQIQLKLNKSNSSGDRLFKIKQDVAKERSRFPCPHCDKRFQWRGNLLRHLKSLEAQVKGHLRCVPCSKSFSSIATYNHHMKMAKNHISEEQFKYICNDCDKKFPNKTLLKEHVDWDHLKNFVHKCTICEKVFKSRTSLYIHNLVHKEGAAGHLCEQCGRSFNSQSKLHTHVRAVHAAEQPYKCHLCTSTFSWHSCLSRHIKVIHQKIKMKRKNKIPDQTLH